MNTNEIYEKIGNIVSKKSNMKTIENAWRCHVKEEIDKKFNEDVPWELCDAILRMYWDSTLIRYCVNYMTTPQDDIEKS